MPKKDLRQMKNEKQRLSKQDIQEIAKKANIKTDLGSVNNSDINSMQDAISKYENKSEGELMSELDRAVSSGKKDGSFSDEMLDKFIKNVAPMMDASQRKKLENLAKSIKNKK